MTEQEALQYLKLWGIDDREAAKIYKLVGGRIIHLRIVANEIKDHNKLEGMYEAQYIETFLTACRCMPVNVLQYLMSTENRRNSS